MRTGLQQTFWAANRIVTTTDIDAGLNKFYSETLGMLFGNVLYPQAGLFGSVALAADGNDKFKLNSYPNPTGMAHGHILALADGDTAYFSGIQFENAAGIDYHIALFNSWIPVGVEVSPKDGVPRIKYLQEAVGSGSANPDSVVDNLDGTLTIVVDSVTESGVSNAGRKITVFLYPLDKAATSEALAWQECTVAWTGGQNKITTVNTPAGAGYFGQTVPSTTASDYLVVLRGPVVSRNTDYSADANYCYLGTVKGAVGGPGNPPASFDASGQILFGTGGMSYLGQITRVENVPPDRLKIDVKAIAAEEGSGIDQIRVSGYDGIGGPKTVFSVDELGNVVIEGDLTVEGETTQEDLVTVNASEIISDALTLGDHDTNDSHLIKGIWTHKDATETDTWFVVDGAQSGHVGIGGAADATYSLHVTGGAKVGGSLVPGTGTKELGDAANRWATLWGSGVDVSSECLASQFYANRSDGPRIDFDRTGASDANHQQHFRIGSMADGVLHFQSYDKDWNNEFTFMAVTKGAATYGVDLIVLTANTRIDLTSDVTVLGDLVSDGGDRSLGNAGAGQWDYFYLSDAATYGMVGNFVPNADGTLTLGNWVWGATDTGYRWASLLATELAAIKASEPSMYLRKTGIAADEKTWRFHIDAGDDLVLETMSDVPASGVSVLKVTRGTGTAITRIDIYKPTYMDATIFTQTVAPVTQHDYFVGAYGTEYLEVYGKDLVASHDSPRVLLRENDQIGTGVDRENWGIVATGGDLAIGAYNSARTSMTEAMHINRVAGDSYAVDSIDFPVAIRTTTYPLIAKGSSGNTFKSDLLSSESGLGSDEGRWRWTTTDDGNGHLKLVTVTDTGGAGVDVLRVIRSSGTAIGNIESYTSFVPETDAQDDLGAISPGNQRWLHGYINRPVIEKRTIANTGDAGTEGMITFDNDYIYCCIGTNSWARVAIATW